MSLDRYKLKHLRKTSRGARRAHKLLKRPDRLIGLILIGNNLVNILASSITTVICLRLFGDAGIAIGTFVLTMVILVFAEVTPKTIAALHPEVIAFPAATILKPLLYIMYPFVWMINVVTNGMLKWAGFDPEKAGEQGLSSEELRTVVAESGHIIPKRHQKMLMNILELGDVRVDDIMIPRNELFAIDIDDDDDTILQQLTSCSYTRIPVYRGEINEVVGLLHMRNAIGCIDEEGLNRKVLLEKIREPYFVPEGASLQTQLLHFQKEQRRMALVVDEYGDLMGAVTLEDILEEIVGEFTSNVSDFNNEIFKQNDGSYIVDGAINVRELNKALDWELPTDGPKTLSGLIIEHLEAFPKVNTGLRIDNYGIVVQKLAGKTIQRARINVLEDEEEDEELEETT